MLLKKLKLNLKCFADFKVTVPIKSIVQMPNQYKWHSNCSIYLCRCSNLIWSILPITVLIVFILLLD